MNRAEILTALKLSEDKYLQLTKMFFSQSAEQCADLNAAIKSGNVDDIRINLHTMKRAAASLKIVEVNELVEALYARIQTGDVIALLEENLPKIQALLADMKPIYTV